MHYRVWQIELREPNTGRWLSLGTVPRREARSEIAEMRALFPDAEFRLLWSGLIVDPFPSILARRAPDARQ